MVLALHLPILITFKEEMITKISTYRGFEIRWSLERFEVRFYNDSILTFYEREIRSWHFYRGKVQELQSFFRYTPKGRFNSHALGKALKNEFLCKVQGNEAEEEDDSIES